MAMSLFFSWPSTRVIIRSDHRDDLRLGELVARPLRRTIQREIEDQLSEKILFGEVSQADRDHRCGGLRPRQHHQTAQDQAASLPGEPKPAFECPRPSRRLGDE